MASKILSFICHVPSVIPGTYPAVPTSTPAVSARTASERHVESGVPSGHFTAIYENDKFVRFKYISNE